MDTPVQAAAQARDRPVGDTPAAPADAPSAQEPPAGAATPVGSAPVLTLIYDPAPEYPVQARLEGVQGSVTVIVRVGSDGQPTGLKIVKASPLGVFEGPCTGR